MRERRDRERVVNVVPQLQNETHLGINLTKASPERRRKQATAEPLWTSGRRQDEEGSRPTTYPPPLPVRCGRPQVLTWRALRDGIHLQISPLPFLLWDARNKRAAWQSVTHERRPTRSIGSLHSSRLRAFQLSYHDHLSSAIHFQTTSASKGWERFVRKRDEEKF